MSNTIASWVRWIQARLVPSVIVATTATTITRDQALHGVVVSNYGAGAEVIFSLPAAVVGMRVGAIVQATQLLSLDPVDGDIIYGIAGAAQTEDVAIKANAVGETVQLVCIIPGKWHVAAYTGTWTVTAA